MANNSKSRKKARVVVKAKTKATNKPKAATKRKPVKRAKAVKQVPVQVGAPPTDMTPPAMEDTRPTPTAAIPEVQSKKVLVADTALGREVSKTVSTGPLVQGASCTWIGPLSATAEDSATQLSLCPHCHGHVIAAADEETMRLGFEAWELGVYPSADLNHPPRPHPGYRGLVTWMRKLPRCWPTIERAAVAYREATGTNVDAGL